MQKCSLSGVYCLEFGRLGRPLGYSMFSLMAFIEDPIY